jgi:uncharacterized membrane protein
VSKMVRLFCCLLVLLIGMMAIGVSGIALAQDQEEPPVTDNVTVPEEEPPVPELLSAPEEEEPPAIEDKVTIVPTYPTVDAIAGGDFEFLIDLSYMGMEDSRVFDLRVTAPQNWDVYMTPRYEKDRKISSVNLKSTYGGTETISLVATAPFWPLPEPGDYKITIEAVSDTVRGSAELTARVTAQYMLSTVSVSQLYNTRAKAGEDNIFPIKVRNLGTDAIDNVKFTSDAPEGWLIDFDPDTIEILDAIDEQTVNVNIKPPSKTVAGDYNISLRATGKQVAASEMNIRVTVETPTVWGWVGVAIILIVVVGLIVIFMRFSRR